MGTPAGAESVHTEVGTDPAPGQRKPCWFSSPSCVSAFTFLSRL